MTIQKVGTNIIDSGYTTTITTNPVFSGTGSATVPSGSTDQRPGSPTVGMIRYNTDTECLEQYTAQGWVGIASPPAISSVSPTTFNGESGTSFTINGQAFDAAATVKFITSGGTEVNAASVSYVNNSQLTATTSRDFTVAEEPLSVKVINSTGLSYTLSSAIDCGATPTWVTASGTLDTKYEGEAVSTSISATDSDSSATISYSIASGLPAGMSLDSSTGAITGTAATNLASDTTYNFNGVATDNAGNTNSRAFSIVIKNDPILDVTTLAAFDGNSATTTPNGYTISPNQITVNYTTNLSSVTGGTWKGNALFRLPVGSLPGDWKNVVAQIPTSGGTTICFWGKIDSGVDSSNASVRPYDLYSRVDEYADFVRSNGVMQFSGGSVNARSITGNGSWAFTDWHFYCIRYSTSAVMTGSSQTQTVTVDNNGTLYTGTFSTTKNGAGQNYSGFMGYNQSNGLGYAWEGWTGGWKVITKNCTDAEVTALYNSSKGYFRP